MYNTAFIWVYVGFQEIKKFPPTKKSGVFMQSSVRRDMPSGERFQKSEVVNHKKTLPYLSTHSKHEANCFFIWYPRVMTLENI